MSCTHGSAADQYLLGRAGLGGEVPGESARDPSVELADCPSLTFSSFGANLTLAFSRACCLGSLLAVLPLGAIGAISCAFRDSPVVRAPLIAPLIAPPCMIEARCDT